jgi:LIM domain kinase 1
MSKVLCLVSTRCSACDCLMYSSNFYFEKNGLLFCKDDYWRKFGECCQACSQLVSGPIMIAGDHRFHPECFCCKVCGSVIGDGDSYALIERSQLYCGSCYKRQIPPSQVQHQVHPEQMSTTVTIIKKPPHSIRLVEIPMSHRVAHQVGRDVEASGFLSKCQASLVLSCKLD